MCALLAIFLCVLLLNCCMRTCARHDAGTVFDSISFYIPRWLPASRNLCVYISYVYLKILDSSRCRMNNQPRRYYEQQQCNLCGNTYSDKFSLARHKRAIHERVSVLCPLCKRNYSGGSAVRRHLLTVHRVSPMCTAIVQPMHATRGLETQTHIKGTRRTGLASHNNLVAAGKRRKPTRSASGRTARRTPAKPISRLELERSKAAHMEGVRHNSFQVCIYAYEMLC